VSICNVISFFIYKYMYVDLKCKNNKIFFPILPRNVIKQNTLYFGGNFCNISYDIKRIISRFLRNHNVYSPSNCEISVSRIYFFTSWKLLSNYSWCHLYKNIMIKITNKIIIFIYYRIIITIYDERFTYVCNCNMLKYIKISSFTTLITNLSEMYF